MLLNGLEYSPLFMFFDLKLPYGKKDIKLFKENTILLQYATSSEFRKEREQTLIGKLAKRHTLRTICNSKSYIRQE